MRRSCGWLVVIVIACGGDDDAGEATAADSGSTTAVTTTATATTMTTTASTAPGEASASEGGSSSDSSTGATGPAGSSEGVASSDGADGSAEGCDPDASDSACIACVKPPCCDDYVACRADAICTCTLDCGLAGGSFGSCSSQCGGENDLYKALYFCGQQSCLGTCDWPKPTGG